MTPVCPYSVDTLLATSAISVLITALLATLVFVLVQVALFKWCPLKFVTGGAQLAHGGEGQEHEKTEVWLSRNRES